MPTSTFFNLPEKKRQRLLMAATSQFAERPYGEVSISDFIQAAGIPRGSFYQYFADKTDLFQYVLQQIGEHLMELLVQCMDACGGQLMELPLVLYDGALQFLQEREDVAHIVLGVLRNNTGVGAGQLWDTEVMIRVLLERADLTTLDISGKEELCALLDLLLFSTGQALGAVCCGMAASDQCRTHLARKVALIRRGVMQDRKEEALC